MSFLAVLSLLGHIVLGHIAEVTESSSLALSLSSTESCVPCLLGLQCLPNGTLDLIVTTDRRLGSGHACRGRILIVLIRNGSLPDGMGLRTR